MNVAAITTEMVKQLREKTGAGMMDCKKALQETDGDIEKAVDELRKRGQAIADKKSSRNAKEGLIFIRVDGGKAALLEFNCETDFVARNEAFQELGNNILDLIMKGGIADVNALVDIPLNGKTVGESIRELIAKIGENMGITRFMVIDQIEGPTFAVSYLHPPGKLGVVAIFTANNAASFAHEAFKTLAHDLAMHIAAASPVAITSAEVAQDLIERERAIYADQCKMEGKPEKMWEKIIDGKIAKFYKQSCLLEQEFVKNPDQSVGALVKEVSKLVGDDLQIVRFERYQVGAMANTEATEED